MLQDHLKVTVNSSSLHSSRKKVVKPSGIQALMFLVKHLKLSLESSYAMVPQQVKDSSTIHIPVKIFSKTNIIKILKNVLRRLLLQAKLSTDLCLLKRKLYNYSVTILSKFH